MTVDHVLREQFDALKAEVATLREELAALRAQLTKHEDVVARIAQAPVRGLAQAEAAIRAMKGKP